jgi:citrate lyase beta subunit
MLFVSAVHPDMIRKAAASGADAVCIDLEDSVPEDQKERSRANVIAALQELDFGQRVRIVRINGNDTPYAYRDIIDLVEAVGDRIDLIMVPKVDAPDDLMFVDRLLRQVGMRCGLGAHILLEAQIETASGFVWLREIAGVSARLDALIWGPGDYSASMQMPASGIGAFDEHDASYPGHRWHAAMHGIVATARANGLRCMDGPYGAHTDSAGFEKSCRISRALGFDGKQCIHPGQLGVARAIFGPGEVELQRAQRILDAYDEARAAGRGAFTLDGEMIDGANVRMARMVLERKQRNG